MKNKLRILPDYIIDLNNKTVTVRSTGEVTYANQNVIDYLSRDYWKEKRHVKREKEHTVSYHSETDEGSTFEIFLMDTNFEPGKIACQKESVKELEQLKYGLTEKEKESLMYCYELGMSAAAAATKLGISRQSMYERKENALKKIKEKADKFNITYDDFEI